MKSLLRIVVIMLLVGGLLYAASWPVARYMHDRNKPQWRTAKVSVGKIVADVKSTGTVKPVLSVSIGSFVSGPITELHADFNQFVKKGDLLARIDPRLYQANVDRGRAELASRQAEVERAWAQLSQARRNEQRALALRKDDPDFISAKEMDAFHFDRMTLEAQLKLAEAAVQQSESSLENSITNLEYTDIVSPVDGMVTDCFISRGQTLAAQFQTPELFRIAPDMDKEMYIFASVDEADIGQIIRALEQMLPVEFTIDAYPDDVFQGKIRQIRKNYTTVENVVTYPVIVSAANPDWKLLPGMTASLSFRVEEKEGVLRVPNSALRFYPEAEHVRSADRDILLGTNEEEEEEDDGTGSDGPKSSDGKAKKVKRHVWIQDGELLKAVEIETGLTDLKYSEVLSGELKEGQELVTGQKLTPTTE